MKDLILIIILFLTHLYSYNTQAVEWTQVTKGKNGHTFFIDMKKIYENNDYIYFWQLINYNEKDEYGDLSAKIFIQGDCKSFKFKWLKVAYHKMFMGKDKVNLKNPSEILSGWQSPNLGSTSHAVLEYACKNRWSRCG